MHMNKKTLIMMMLPFLLTACSGNTDPTNTSGSGSGEEGPIVVIDTDEYDDWANSWSKPGHLYFHYNRGEKKGYENYCLWMWQHDPQDLEGALWGFSADPKVSDKLTLQPMSTSFMTYEDVGKSSEGSGTFIDNFGVIFDVDYSSTTLKGGKTGSSTTYEGASEIGFLLPQQDSMSGATNWVSDGGRETYLENIDNPANWRTIGDGKAIHVFVATGALDDYAFWAGEAQSEAKVNPVNDDTTGQYSSAVDTKYSNSLGNTATSEAFKNDGVGYQIFVASFRDSDGDGKGDLRGIINALDEGFFDDLNVNVLWLTPIQKSDSYHGYDISDYYSVDKKFGTIDDYQELIYKAHHRTKPIKVLMDLVLNHTSKSNKWFINSQWAVEEDGFNWRDVYTWKFENEYIDKWNGSSYTKVTVKEDAESDNPSWYRDGESHYYYYGKFGSGMPEINYLSANTRKLVINMARYWLSFGLDGFRLDAVKHIFMRDECYQDGDVIIQDVGTKESFDDEKGKYVTKAFDYSSNITKNIMWWKEFAHGVKAAYPNCFLVGENFDGWGTRTAPYYQALDSQFSFSHYYHIPAYLYTAGGTPRNFYDLQAAESYDTYAGNGPYVLDAGEGKPKPSVEGGRRSDFIDGPFTSNHDVMRGINQVNGSGTKSGTTALDKVTDTGDNDTQIKKAKIHAAITLLSQGVSWIYYGDELGMSSNTDEHIAMYGSENSIDVWYRQPYLWGDATITPKYRAGQYCFGDISGTKSQYATKDPYGYDSHNLALAKYNEQKTDPNSMYSWYKTLTDIKNQFPYGHHIEYHGYTSGNVLVIKASGVAKNGKSSKVCVFIHVGTDTSDYYPNPGEVLGGAYVNIGTLGGAPTDAAMDDAHNMGKNNPYSVTAFKLA